MDTTTHYTVLARRFRPQTFDDVIGQQHVSQALKNALQSGRVAHAYLFTGARGVGKTSMARILAKALNCPNVTDGIPCHTCEICEGIAAGNDVDVLEIDGASNRRIDDIRDLRANVAVRSMRTPFKVYIIDEVHMLTKEAFNALLKTLEEPPPNVKFVFCTTEPNKVPDTILSRCQRFDFATIATQNIIERLTEIADAEGFTVEPAALELVARRAAGSMRDSQSLFDQLLAFGSEQISAGDVHRLLGTADDDRLTAIVDALTRRDRETALQEFDAALTDGVQLGEFIDQLIHYFRDLMMSACGAEKVALLSLAELQRPRVATQAESWGLEAIVAALQILVEARGQMFRTVFARSLVELALVRLTLLDDLEGVAALIRQITTGGGSSIPAARPEKPRLSPPRPAPPAPAIDPPSDPAADGNSAGKNADSESDRHSQPGATIDLVRGSETEILSQLVDNSEDASRVHLRRASLAISGPNQVDLFFDGSYNFSKQYCDRPEIRMRIERILSRMTGNSVAVTVRIDRSQPATPPPVATRQPHDNTPVNSLDVKQADKDPFVQEAVTIFGGTVKKVEPL
ncbi:MAG: DNA polymerase III subunit gamma/tau [Planctomycetaceae bacterium]